MTANGVRLHYLDWAARSERTILVIPGAGWTHSFSYLGGLWAAASRVVALGVRGLGESDGAEPYTWEAVVADVVAAVAQLDLRPPIVVVGGQGAAAWALLYAAHHRDDVAHVFTLDYEVPTGPHGTSGARHRGKSWPTIDAAADEVLDRWKVPPTLRSIARDALPYFFVQRSDGSWEWAAGVRIGSNVDACEFYVCEPELRSVLREVRCPVDAFVGGPAGERSAAILESELAEVRVHRIPDGGHLLQLSAPDLVARTVRDRIGSRA